MFFNSINATAIKSKPVNVHFGKRQVFKITAIADVAGATGGKYFKLELCLPTALLETAKKILAVYFTVGGVGAAPSVPDAANVAVDITSGDSDADILEAIMTALSARDEIKLCYIENGALYVEAMWFGKSAAIVDGGTTFTFATVVEGYGGFLGATEGGAEITPETASEDITSDQTGEVPLATIIKSTKFSIKTTVKELTQERMKLLFGRLVGEVFTPAAVGGTEVIGLGTSKVGLNASAFNGELILKPINKDADDHSENIHFFSCSVLPGGLNFGQEALSTEVTFTPYVDSTKDKRANIGCFGDGFQDLRPAV